uniref:CCHC-type domain-containing protein n=1 Tax=Brassica oleracea var. oleracea TaxID=109376 RepID=A0A0D2ZT55_BRAOL
MAGLSQQIQHTITLFNPLTLSEAHQQALTIESQTKGNFSWSASRSTRPSQQQLSSSTTDDAPPLQTDTAAIPFTDKTQTRPSSLRCFACGEIGHRLSNCPKRNRRGLLLDATGNDVEVIYDEEVTETIAETEDLVADHGPCLMVRRVCLAPHHTDENPQWHSLFHSKCNIAGKVCKFIIDSGSCENVVAEDVVNKLKLTTELHPCPYKLAWLDKKTDLMIARRALVSFSIGGKFKDQVQCDIAPMDACHLLLGLSLSNHLYPRNRAPHQPRSSSFSGNLLNKNFEQKDVFSY